MLADIKDKVFVVTGSSSGIGAALALAHGPDLGAPALVLRHTRTHNPPSKEPMARP